MKQIKIRYKKSMQDLFKKDKIYQAMVLDWDLIKITAEDKKEHIYKILVEKNNWFEEIK